MLILFRGLPTSGKTTLSCALAQRLGLVVLDRDILKATAFRVCRDDTMAGVLSYQQLCALAERQLGLGLSLIIDAPFSKPAELEAVVSVARNCHVRVKLIHCCAPTATFRARMLQRQGRVSEVQWSGKSGWAKLAPFLEGEIARSSSQAPAGADMITTDTSKPLEDCLDEIVAWLAAPSTTGEKSITHAHCPKGARRGLHLEGVDPR